MHKFNIFLNFTLDKYNDVIVCLAQQIKQQTTQEGKIMTTTYSIEINTNGTATIYQTIKIGSMTKKMQCQTCNNETQAKAVVNYMSIKANQ